MLFNFHLSSIHGWPQENSLEGQKTSGDQIQILLKYEYFAYILVFFSWRS